MFDPEIYPKISIITACFNSEKYIEDTIKSVINQTYPHIEYVIVDGSSTDSTLEIVKKYEKEIDLILSEPDQGIYDAFNKGIKVAKGDIIYFLNSDDYLYHNSVIEKVAAAFVQNPDAIVVYGNICMSNEQNGFFKHIGSKVRMENFLKGIMPPHPGMFIQKATIKKFLFDTKYSIAADFDLVIKVFKENLNRSVYINETISYFRIGGISSQLKHKKLLMDETKEIVNSHFGESQLIKELSLDQQNVNYFKKWVELLLVHKKTISSALVNENITNVALFGSLENSIYVLHDLLANQLHVHVFLDNDSSRQGYLMNGVPIHSPEWLRNNGQELDAIIFTFEGNYDEEVKKQIESYYDIGKVKIYSWKDLIEKTIGEGE